MVDKKYFILVHLMAILSIAYPSFAQKRITEIEPVLVSPEAGAKLIKGVPYPLDISIKNNGPDDLIAGDTLFINIDGNGRIYPIIIEEPIAAGTTVSIIESEFTMTISETSPGVTGPFCIQLMDVVANSIKIGGVPVDVTYSDPDISNNIVCNRITVKPAPPTTLEDPDVAISSVLRIYPNPAVNEVYVRSEQPFSERTLLRITDISGRQVLLRMNDETNVTANSLLRLDVSSLNSGLYFLELSDGSRHDKGVLIIQR